MAVAPSASYSFTVRMGILNRPGMLGRVTSVIGKAGGDIGAVDLVEMTGDRVFRDMTIKARDSEHGQRIIDKLRKLPVVKISNISDRTFLMHLGGKIEVRSKVPIRTRDDLSMAYTPGVARVSLAIKEDPQRAFSLTIKQNCVAVVTDGGVGAAGTAVIKMLMTLGVRQIIGVDEHGTIHRGRTVGMDFMKTWVSEATNPQNVKGKMPEALKDADVFIGLSVPGVLALRDVKRMARDRIVFAMANPVPEIQPEQAERHVRVMATGRSDDPNQINNVLCFPGFFRGLLYIRARLVN